MQSSGTYLGRNTTSSHCCPSLLYRGLNLRLKLFGPGSASFDLEFRAQGFPAKAMVPQQKFSALAKPALMKATLYPYDHQLYKFEHESTENGICRAKATPASRGLLRPFCRHRRATTRRASSRNPPPDVVCKAWAGICRFGGSERRFGLVRQDL